MDRVVVGALVRDDRILLALRRPDKRAFPGVWELPGGVLEPGESEQAALARELHEELGVRIATETASHLCRLTVGAAGEQAVLSAWLVNDWAGTPSNVAPEEHDGVAWFRVDELPPPAHGPVRRALLTAMSSRRPCRP